MNRISVLLIAIIAQVLVLSSCCKRKIYCEAVPLDFAFVGFTRAEVRSIILRKHYWGNPYGPVLDSAQYMLTGTGGVTTPGKPDTIYFSDYATATDFDGLHINSDYGIYLPVLGKTIYITDMINDGHNSELVRCGDNETKCAKYITGFSVDGGWQEGRFTYLVKAQ